MSVGQEEGGSLAISVTSDWLPDFFFFEHFLSLQRYPKGGEVRGLKDMRQIEQREMGKMGNKVVKATEGIMDETGTICKGKQKVKVQGGKYF